MEFAGRICFTCQVEVAPCEVRRQRWGHIELPWPVCHPEYVRGSSRAPGPLAHWTGLEQSELEGLVYRRRYRVDSLDAGQLRENRNRLLQSLRPHDRPEGELPLIEGALDRLQALRPGDWISREEMAPIHLLRSALAAIAPGEFERLVVIRSGAEAILPLLALAGNPDRGRVTLECLPVIPAGLRDFRDLNQRRIAWHEVNDLYRRVIHRNQRLRKLSEVAAPVAVLDAEKQRLQELVDALIDNARAPQPVLNERGRPLSCLSDFAGDGLFEYGS
jgi:DNA-directed RNA polymerase subunit beta'